MTAEQVAGSFRDRKGYVFTLGNRVFRSVSSAAAPVQREFIESKVFAHLVAAGQFIGTKVASEDPAELGIPNAALLLEHERIAFVSFPYEWPFAALRAAALLQLDVHLQLLDHGFTLSDASAYNIQFRGPKPVFIDCLSVERYVEGSYWLGHRQFCDQFLSPLLFSAKFGVPFNAMYRGRLEGFSTTELASLLRLRDKFSLQTLLNVVIPSRLETSARRGRVDAKKAVARRALPKSAIKPHRLDRLRQRQHLPKRRARCQTWLCGDGRKSRSAGHCTRSGLQHR
jgi:hypothetical protein